MSAATPAGWDHECPRSRFRRFHTPELRAMKAALDGHWRELDQAELDKPNAGRARTMRTLARVGSEVDAELDHRKNYKHGDGWQASQ